MKKRLVGLSKILVSLNLIPFGLALAQSPESISDKIKSLYSQIRPKTEVVSTLNIPFLSNLNASQLEVDLPNNLRVNIIYGRGVETRGQDYAQVCVSKKIGDSFQRRQVFFDAGLDGIKKTAKTGTTHLDEMPDTYLLRRREDKFPKPVLQSLSNEDIKSVNRTLTSCLEELLAYSDSEGQVKDVYLNDQGSRHPLEVPTSGLINWGESLPEFFTTSMDVIFRGGLVDRIRLLRINPGKYRFDVYNDLQLRTVEEWRESLDAIAVVNGSYFGAKPWGLPITPTVSNGKRIDKRGAVAFGGGVFLAEPRDSKKPKAKFIDLRVPTLVDKIIQEEGYNTAIFSYPVLLDKNGRTRTSDPIQRRANRTFLGQDGQGYIIIGNTEEGFFSLKRLGSFLKAAESLDLVYALNMDGGSVACMDVAAGNFRYTNYARWESVLNKNKEEVGISCNDLKYGKWKMPIAIAVKQR